MKIVDWAELSKMPAGTVFQSVSAYHLGELSILGDVWDGVHLIEASLRPRASDSIALSLTAEQEAALGIKQGGPVVSTPSGFGRDYGPGRTNRWLVWEQADRERLAGWLLDPAKACAEMNDEPHMLMKVEDLA